MKVIAVVVAHHIKDNHVAREYITKFTFIEILGEVNRIIRDQLPEKLRL